MAFSVIDSDSDEAKSSTRRIAHQVAEEVLRTKCSVTLRAGDFEEELSHGSRNGVASPPRYNATTTGTVTRPTLQAVSGPRYLARNFGVQTEEEDLSYPYPRYSNHPDSRSDVK